MVRSLLDSVCSINRTATTSDIQMNVSDLNSSNVVTATVRDRGQSVVAVKLNNNGVKIKAYITCENTLDEEDKARRKILKCLGFDNNFIESLYND